jgi:hypothetical protein
MQHFISGKAIKSRAVSLLGSTSNGWDVWCDTCLRCVAKMLLLVHHIALNTFFIKYGTGDFVASWQPWFKTNISTGYFYAKTYTSSKQYLGRTYCFQLQGWSWKLRQYVPESVRTYLLPTYQATRYHNTQDYNVKSSPLREPEILFGPWPLCMRNVGACACVCVCVCVCGWVACLFRKAC